MATVTVPYRHPWFPDRWCRSPGLGNTSILSPPILGYSAFTIPALVALALTKPIIEYNGKTMTWNRSALLALTCTVFGVIITFIALASSITLIPLFYAISLGFVFGLRLLVLVAIADYRISRMWFPALTQSGVGILARYGGLLAIVRYPGAGAPYRFRTWICCPYLDDRTSS